MSRKCPQAPDQTVVIGTRNKDKLRELTKLMGRCGVRVLSLQDFPAAVDVDENGKTFEANARKKASFYSRQTHLLTLADDSGLSVASLHGKPGVYSARFAGEGCSYEANNRKLLKLLATKNGQQRRAKFICVTALYNNGSFVGVVKGECRGRIASSVRGRHGFGYDPVFIPQGYQKTFSELPSETKNRISHRGKALRAVKKLIFDYYRMTSRGRR